MQRSHFWLIVTLAIALALRLTYALSQDHVIVYGGTGGDSWIYLRMGYNLVTGHDYSRERIPTPPLYLVFNGLIQRALFEPVGIFAAHCSPLISDPPCVARLFQPTIAIVFTRIIQCLLGTLTCNFAYRTILLVSRNQTAALLGMGVLAVSPVFVVEPALILTETLYIFLVSGGMWLYLLSIDPAANKSHSRLILAAALFGLATLTRAALLLFPLGLALHLLMTFGWREGLKRALLLLLVYSLTLSTWTVYNAVKWDKRWVIAAEGGFIAFLYIGATDWEGPQQVDANLVQDAGAGNIAATEPDVQQELYQQAAANVIGRDPAGWARKRVSEVITAYLQPHGTNNFPGQSLKDLMATWLTHDRTLGGLLALTQAESFWPKFIIYLFHYIGLITGWVGIWLTRQNWRLTLPMIGFIVYTTLVHLALDAIPRYLFPMEIFWWVFAAVAISRYVGTGRVLSLRVGIVRSGNKGRTPVAS
jgi:4-amino-4-deoxy-L-arabinose transferase-like glycosyltransferase